MMRRTIRELLPAIAMGAMLLSCGKTESEAHAEPKAAASQAAAPAGQAVIPVDSPQLSQIRVEPVTIAMVPVDTVSSPGKVEANANRLAHVTLQLTGRITAVYAKIGDFVRQGQPLMTVESPDADAAVSSSLQAQATVTQAKSALAKAQMDLDRQKDLFEHGAVPQKEVLNGQAVVVQAQASVEQAQASAEQARRKLQILGIGAFGQKVTVSAPISGKVLELSVASGEFRNDLSAPLMTIADLSSVWVTSDVPETAIRLVRTGEQVHIQLSAYPNETFQGRVTLIGDVVDPQTRTVKVRAEMPNPGGRLKPEMFGNIQLAEHTEPRPTVPSAAIIAVDGKAIVWREKSKGVFEKVTVTLGTQTGDRVAVVSGLGPRDRVVVDGVMLLSAN
jgi:cobalt-zinc-cadmium efflux system membrane fusion protein